VKTEVITNPDFLCTIMLDFKTKIKQKILLIFSGSVVLNDCCFEFFPNPVNKTHVFLLFVAGYKARFSCYICAYPNASWVEKVIKHLDSDSP
uniref:Chemokine interleukin-8-like domain-containing protein n=1 Tax=Fundulus heteroclitus TaxID=8078 RepID=A0A3Q2P6D8_FUNHE